jgi:hypothetical protein
LCFTAYFGFLAWGVALNQDVQDAKSDPSSTEAQIESLQGSRNAKYWLAGLTLFLSVVDAYVDAHLRSFDDRIDAEVGALPGPDGPGVSLALRATWGGGSSDARR